MLRRIVHSRDNYYAQTTIGEISIEAKHFCYTLEDTVRPYGIKVTGETAIPQNTLGYNVSIRHSNKFNRPVLVLSNHYDKITIEKDGVTFGYVYSHGGNKHDDTEGCILVAFNVNENEIYGTAEAKLFKLVKKWIDAGDTVKWCIYNNKQEE